MNYKLAISLI